MLERDNHPAPEAAHKVGESTVEIGAHYLDTVLGLDAHLRERQLRKFGFRFFFSERTRRHRRGHRARRQPLPAYARLPARPRHPGKLSGRARERARHPVASPVPRARDPAGRKRHTRRAIDHHGQEHELTADWLVDASGRAGLLRRKLGLQTDNGHHANAAWFRLATRMDIDDWSQDASLACAL